MCAGSREDKTSGQQFTTARRCGSKNKHRQSAALQLILVLALCRIRCRRSFLTSPILAPTHAVSSAHEGYGLSQFAWLATDLSQSGLCWEKCEGAMLNLNGSILPRLKDSAGAIRRTDRGYLGRLKRSSHARNGGVLRFARWRPGRSEVFSVIVAMTRRGTASGFTFHCQKGRRAAGGRTVTRGGRGRAACGPT